MISPAAAYVLASWDALQCMLGYKYLSPFLARRLRLQDQCGIHNLHGLTGLISSLAGICAILLATEETYGPSLYQTFSYRAPPEGDPLLEKLQELIPDLEAGLGRTAQEQALFQVAAVFGDYYSGGQWGVCWLVLYSSYHIWLPPVMRNALMMSFSLMFLQITTA